MSTIYYKGTLLPLIKRYMLDFDPAYGYVAHEDLSCGSYSALLAYAQQYGNLGVAYSISSEDGRATLRLDDSTGQTTIDSWQVLANELQKTGAENPVIQAGLSVNDIAVLVAAVNDNLSTADAVAKLNEVGGVTYVKPPTGISTAALVNRFYNLLKRGSTHYATSQYVLRHTTNAPARYASNIADFNIEKIYSVAQLLTETQNGGLWIYPLPGRLAYKIQNLVAPTVQPNYYWGWLKRSATETTAANNRIEITTEYWLEQWSTDYYGYAT